MDAAAMDKVTPAQFGHALKSHVDLSEPIDRDHGSVTDHWTISSLRGQLGGSMCAAHHGLFDTLFRRTVILPRSWYAFKQQYLSPVADWLFRLQNECQGLSVYNWEDSYEYRNAFPMHGDFWFKKTQQANFQVAIKYATQRGLIREGASRRYQDDPHAKSFLCGGKWHDVPGCYDMLDHCLHEVTSGGRSSFDMPRIQDLYGPYEPTLHLVADTVDYSNSSLTAEVRQLIEKSTHPVPKSQTITYVMGERLREMPGQNESRVWFPRLVGSMSAYVLEHAYGSTSGTIFSDMTFMVPGSLTAEEQKSLPTDLANWECQRKSIIEDHPRLWPFIEAVTK